VNRLVKRTTLTFGAGRRGSGCGLIVILVGLGFILGSVPLLIWNEGRAVATYRTLIEGAAIVRSISSRAVDPVYEGRLVHLVGVAATAETLYDPDLGVSASALKLRRTTEMYQWRESEREDSNGDTSYSYTKTWSESLINSRSFHRSGYDNPANLPYPSQTWTAEVVTLGAYTLSESLVEQINKFESLPANQVPRTVDRKILLPDGGFYLGADPASPQIGDVRIRYAQVLPTTVSIISMVSGNSFRPYQGKAGDTIDLLDLGEHSAAQMIATAQSENEALTWALRLAGAFAMMLGFQALNQPLASLLRLIPFMGRAAQKGFGCLVAVVAAMVAAPLSVGTIAVSWLFFHLR
jgi:hypothetical protein